MELQDPRLRSLLRQANKVADSGKKAAAEQLYRQLLDEAPDVAEGWFGLGQVLNDAAQQKEAYKKAVSLEPDYAPAVRALAELRGEPVPEWAIEPPELEEVEPEPEPETVLIDHEHTAVPTEAEEEFELACYRHPNRPTSLRCYNCGKPICSSCAIKTPVGYSCPDCIREKEEIFFNATTLDYVIAPAIGLVLSLIAGYLVSRFAIRGGFIVYIGALFLGGIVGRIIGQFSKQAIGRRRGRYLPHVMVAMLVLGTAVWLLPILIFAGFGSLFAFIGPGIFLFVAGGALFSYMK
ncbi:B-box zinc finger protein [Candidatus Leptofilum sp.]|uniref:B-box zinc finger protein n=1 Tax=Candidatus Leptofilum sp. TaxID=3241576 RepID=UPI003B592327